jgi:hypothetical protein
VPPEFRELKVWLCHSPANSASKSGVGVRVIVGVKVGLGVTVGVEVGKGVGVIVGASAVWVAKIYQEFL